MKKKHNLIILHVIICLFALFFACSEDVVIQDIVLEKSEFTIMVGEVRYIKTVILPSNADRAGIKWSSSNSEIASVNNGEVMGIKEGEATITISTPNKTVTCKVIVTSKSINIQSILFEKNEITLIEGDSHQLVFTLLPENATNKEITWTSDRDSVATVDTTGNVTAITAGETYVTATTSDGKKASCKIIVEKKGKVTGVELDHVSILMGVGEEKTLIATVQPEDAINKNVSWSTSDANIVTVDNAGKVTAIAKGEAVVTVTTEEGGKTAECRVSVVLTFRDDFNRANTGQKGIDTPNGVGQDWLITYGEFEIKDQALYAYYNKSKPNHSVLLYNAPGAITKTVGGSFKFSCDVKIPPGTWGGILFNAQSSSSYYVLRVKTNSNQLQFLATANNGVNWKVLSTEDVKPRDIFTANTTLRFTVESLEPGKYYASITDLSDSKCLGEFILTDNQNFNYSNGQAGFWTMGSAVVYDNFVLGVK